MDNGQRPNNYYRNNNSYIGKKVERNNFNNNNKYQSNNYNSHYKNNNYNNNYNNRYNNKPGFNNRYNNNNHNFNGNKNNTSSNNNNNKILPIFSKKKEIIEELGKNRVIIISGNTGCGKSTQVPQFIFEQIKDKKILITQPRRIAAISIAKRLSYEMKTKLGELIGYHVSMISNFSKNTKIFVKTTGVFLEELLHNNITEYSYIIIDEVHERDLYVDLVLALLKNYFYAFPDCNIKVILMSATIAEKDFAKYLDDINNGNEVPIIKIKENWHKVNDYFLEDVLKEIERMDINQKLKKKIRDERNNILCMDYDLPIYCENLFPVVTAIIENIENNESKKTYNNKNGVLIFIPGYNEIQDLLDYLSNYFIQSDNFEFLILHSQITDEDQEKVFQPCNKRKIILATNIAESSITISNIDYVIDFCLVKQDHYDENQNTSILRLQWCSQASCQQRKGRTGRIREGTYYRLVKEELYKKFNAFQVPEIQRSPLETPILKLKIYDENEEPEKILKTTMNPPDQKKIINTIFRLQKMGAIINLEFGKNDDINELNDINQEIHKNNDDVVFKKKKPKENKEIKYKSGRITKVGKIFAELNVDIKYSRLIIISYALGQVDTGITLAAILSQERNIFIDSNKVNRAKLYDSKRFFCKERNCDFIASYTAYKQWCSKFKNEYVNDKIEFDTRFKRLNRIVNQEEIQYCNGKNLNRKVLREVLRLENDLKKRLSKINLYSKHFDLTESPLNLNNDKTAFILKIILAGTFYDQIFAPKFLNFNAVENDIKELNEGKEQKYLYTLSFHYMQKENWKELCEMFEAVINPGKIVEKKYEKDCEILTIKLSDIDSVRKILFITAPSLKRNSEISLYTYITQNDSNEVKKKYIKISKEPEYTYNISFCDTIKGGNIEIDKDSVNLTYIVKDFQELQKTLFVTDSYINKGALNNRKFARYTSLLPRIKMLDKLIMLIFGPKYEMVAEEIKNNNLNNINNSKKYSHYIGFQSHEFDFYFGSDIGSFYENNELNEENIIKINLVKFNYLITNFHLKQINEIRYKINQMMNFKFESPNENEELNKKQFAELKNKYNEKANEILMAIKKLIDCEKIKYINEDKYEELYEYIQNYNRNHKFNYKEEKDMDIDENENDENNNEYNGYINEINDIKSKIKEDDFLQIQEPLKIQDEFFINDAKIQKKIAKEKRIYNIYSDYSKILSDMKSLISSTDAWLCCPNCLKDICCVKDNYPKSTNINIGEYLIQGSFIKSELKIIEKNKDYRNKESFEKNLKLSGLIPRVQYDNLFSCPGGETILGYVLKGERYIYYKSELCVRYPNLKVERVNETDFMNKFQNINNKVKDIMKWKESDEFKKNLGCKLCEFTVEKKVNEFKKHLNDKFHKQFMEELKEEFLS